MDPKVFHVIIVGGICYIASALIVTFTHLPYGTCMFNICYGLVDGVVA